MFESFLFDKLSKSLIVESKDKCALHPHNNMPTYKFTCLFKEDQAASSLGNLEKLISIELCACTKFESFSRSICSLQFIRKLTFEGDITEVPKDLHHLLYLEELYLSKTKIQYLPDSICRLKQLKHIKLEDCDNFEKLPEDFGQLDSLEELILSNSKIEYLPDSVCMLKHLKSLKLRGCKHFKRLPKSFGQLECQEKIGRLGCLQELDITDTAISHLPRCILMLKGLRIIGSKMMLESFGFTSEIQSSDNETFVNITTSIVDEKLVGMEKRINDFLSCLDNGTQDVRMIGIKGMGGGGKTTLARAVYDQISNHFEGKIFVDNVRKVSKSSLGFGLKMLQQKMKHVLFRSVGERRDRMNHKRILLVLDDVDCIEQLEALVGETGRFKSGSIIIITTRDEKLLLAHKVNFVHDANLLSSTEAICLFSRYAFGGDNPLQGYEELSRKVVNYAAGLPLTAKVLGSFLCGKDKLEWVDAIDRLEKIPLKDTLKKLELGYMSLEDECKEIFLDIACILKGRGKEDAIRILECCGFHGRNGLKVLEQRSLITYDEDGLLGMHDVIEEMGKSIVRRLNPDEPNKHSRLWIHEEIEDIFANDMGTQATKCLSFYSKDINAEIAMKGLANMSDLRFLEMNLVKEYYNTNCLYHKLDKVGEHLPSSLRFMRWSGFPFSSLPNTFQGNHLVYLYILYSDIVQLWEDGEEKVLNNLRFLIIDSSKLRTFDLGLAPNLEELTIDFCHDFVELHTPADHCLKLQHLHLSWSKLTNLHLGNAPNLERVNLVFCRDLVEFQMPSESLKLEHLHLTYSKLKTIHLGNTPNLERLILKGCYDLVLLPELGRVKCLKELNIKGTGIRRLPQSIFHMKGLRIIGSTEILEACGLKSEIQTCKDIFSEEEIFCVI